MIVDAHLDMAYNAIRYGRDLRLPLDQLRRQDAGSEAERLNGQATVTIPSLIEGGVGLVFGTLFVGPAGNPIIVREDKATYDNQDQAHQMAMNQLDYYHRLADEVSGVRLVTDRRSLEEVTASHETGGERLLGIVPLMEGADPIRQPEEAALWYERGLRLIGLAWDDTVYSPGAWGAGGGLTPAGRRLLVVMADLGFILDLTHMSEKATMEALDSYEGVIVATHSNARALVPGQRHFSDQQIQGVAERGGVIGIALYNSFLQAGYRKGNGKEKVTLEQVVNHMDHICQLTGSAAHVGIGSDMDGGFGREDMPAELDSAADLPKIGQALRDRGYAEPDIAGILGGNWVNCLRSL